MVPPDDERPAVNRPTSWVAFVILFVLVGGAILLGLAMQGQDKKTSGSRSYDRGAVR